MRLYIGVWEGYGMNELDQLLSYVFLHDNSYNACINSPFQMKSNQIKIHRVHPTSIDAFNGKPLKSTPNSQAE